MFERKDSFYRRAKAEGYRSRAAYKLLELNRRYSLIKKGDAVLDLGCAPGGWLQVALELIGSKGKAVGVDLLPVQAFQHLAAVVVRGDFREEAVQGRVRAELGGKANAVLCDLSPNLTGVKHVDDERAEELAREVLGLLPSLLAPKGNVLLKFFVGPKLAELSGKWAGRFRSFRATRPQATRKTSSEIYLIGLGYLGEERENG